MKKFKMGASGKKKLRILGVFFLIAVSFMVGFFISQNSISGMAGMAIPGPIAANEGKNETPVVYGEIGVPAECLNKTIDSGGSVKCTYSEDLSSWKCELEGEGLIQPAKANGSSMYPTITPDTLVMLKYIDFAELEVCDIIGFKQGGTVLLHRIVQLDKDNECAYTKGDNNAYGENVCIKPEEVIGKVVVLLKGVGYKTFFEFNISEFES